MSISSQVPDAGTPIFDDRGYINPVWHEFFFNLLRRTGGTVGVDASTQEGRIKTLERRTVEIEGYEYSEVPNFKPKNPIDLGFAHAHGVQYDPLHHAIATITDNGFLSSVDKVKLDSLTSGAAVSSVSGTSPIVSTGGATPVISILPATGSAAGSLSAADKAKLDAFSYSEASWTPVLTFDTPGNLNVVYSTRTGYLVQVGRKIFLQWYIQTSTFTHTTASGNLKVTGFPFTPSATFPEQVGPVTYSGLTLAGFLDLLARVLNASAGTIQFVASSSGGGRALMNTTNTTSGTNIFMQGSIEFII